MTGRMVIKLRATITIDMEAEGFMGAAEVQKEIEALTQELQDKFGPATYDLRERRDRGPGSVPEPEAPKPKQTRAPRKKKPSEDNPATDGEAG